MNKAWGDFRSALDAVPSDGYRRVRPMEDRLWEKVEPTGVCWNWTGSVRSDGYGAFYVGMIDGKRANLPAHRVVYEVLVGRIPNPLVLDHLCRNRSCVNPDHVEPVEQLVNARRNPKPGRPVGAGRLTLCKKGLHDLELHAKWRGPSRKCQPCLRTRLAAKRAAS